HVRFDEEGQKFSALYSSTDERGATTWNPAKLQYFFHLVGNIGKIPAWVHHFSRFVSNPSDNRQNWCIFAGFTRSNSEVYENAVILQHFGGERS
ncbi:hypothetical protein, partial [Paenibacillus thiaminolyticus]|uniref:hypothetical protein n=1 Tax=Paenibacillus thiaminolyticus TaxID=49283 RepID=UPI001C723B47